MGYMSTYYILSCLVRYFPFPYIYVKLQRRLEAWWSPVQIYHVISVQCVRSAPEVLYVNALPHLVLIARLTCW